jgi:hypothetical protein
MSSEHPNASTAGLGRYLKEPRRENPALRARVQAFVVDRLRFVHQEAGWSNWRESGRWSFTFDEHGRNVPEALGDEQSAATSARWIWTFAVSERGPLITSNTFSLMTEERDGVKHKFYGPDQPSRANALEWTQQIAREFGLHYVDAKMLRDWEVSYDEVDPEFDLEHDVLAVPNAFQVLFYE